MLFFVSPRIRAIRGRWPWRVVWGFIVCSVFVAATFAAEEGARITVRKVPRTDEDKMQSQPATDSPRPMRPSGAAGAASENRGPLYRQYPPEQVIVGDVDNTHLLTRRQLEKRVRTMVPAPKEKMDEIDQRIYDNQLVRAEGEALQEWAILKGLVRLAELEKIQVSPAEVEKSMTDLLGGGDGQKAKSSSSGNAPALGIDPEELREQVRDAILIDRFMARDIERRFTDAQLKEIYERSPGDYIHLEAWRVRQIFRRVEASMGADEKKDIRSEFYALRKKAARNGGRDFEKYARENSDYPNAKEEAGDMGWIDFSMPMDEDMTNAIKSLKIGEVSNIIETKAGYHILRIEAYRPAEGAQWGDFARKKVTDRILFDLKNRMGPGLLRNVPFPVRLNASGLRLVGEAPKDAGEAKRPAATPQSPRPATRDSGESAGLSRRESRETRQRR